MRFTALLGVLAASQDISEQEFGGTALIGTGGIDVIVVSGNSFGAQKKQVKV